MNLIDVTIVNVALPRFQVTLGASDSALQWIVAGYTLAFALMLLPAGRLGDTFGRKRIFLWGVAGFTTASLLCGLAPTIETLIAARLVQGVAGAMMTPQTLAIIQVIFPPNERASAFSLFGFASGLAAVAGPVIGGVLVQANLFGLDWRPIFLINLPFGILFVLLGIRIIPDIEGQRALGVDLKGIGLAAFGLGMLVYPAIEGRNHDWPLWAFAMMAAGLVLIAAFVRYQFARADACLPQVFPATLLGNRPFLAMAGISSLFFSVIPAFFLCFTITLQSGYGLSPLQSGLVSLPFSIGVLVTSLVSAKLANRWLTARLVSGALLLAFAMSWVMMRTVPGLPVDNFTFAVPLLLGGIGLGLGVSPMFQRALATVPPQDSGAASGGLQTIQQTGGVIGVAVMGEIFFTLLAAGGGVGDAAHANAFARAQIYAVIAYLLVAMSALVRVGEKRN